MSIRAYQDKVPAECCICLEQEPNSKSLIQTVCCRANTIATQIIPKTYHKNCLMEWARRQPEDYFSCINCQRKIPKSELFSKMDTIKQLIFSSAVKNYFIKVGFISILQGYSIGILAITEPFYLSNKRVFIVNLLLCTTLTYTEIHRLRHAKFNWSMIIAGATVFSFLILNAAYKATILFLNTPKNI